MVIKHICSYEFTVEERIAIATTTEVLKQLRTMLNCDIVCTSNSEIHLNSALFVLNSLLNNDGKEICTKK